MADSSSTDISPCNDNRPYTAQQGLWRNFQWEDVKELAMYEFRGFPLAKVIMLMILAVTILIAIPLNLIPYFKKGEKLKATPWLYFFTLGMAFMFVEIMLIQKYTLFIGPSIYSIITILLTLLLASGFGSLFSTKFNNKIVFLAILIWLGLEVTLFHHIFYALEVLTQIPRVIVSALLIFPLGFFMGMPFPKGSLRVGELVDWGFAINGTASVIGSTIVMLIAFSFGINIALAFGALLYLIAFGLYSMKKAW